MQFEPETNPDAGAGSPVTQGPITVVREAKGRNWKMTIVEQMRSV